MREYKDKINAQKQDYYKDRFYHAPETKKSEVSSTNFQKILNEFKALMQINEAFIENDFLVIKINKDDNLKALNLAKDLNFLSFTELVVSDYIKDGYYLIQYLLLNLEEKLRLQIQTTCNINECLNSGVSVYKGLNWSEREAYDMLGIKIINHPNLKRLLMPDDWFEHPLKKSYPLQGDEHAQWYEIDRIFGKEYRSVVKEENRDPAFVDDKDTTKFGRIYHEVANGAQPIEIAYKQEYQEEEGVMFVKKIKRNDSKFIEGRR
ncbi:NADH-quinone oxidoreductase subunit C [Campylobacter canadensis]|uniref:NADH-quinone oxidoreductase subunit C n=1 Tax=Campylobacter canadensis TaxID=449520 RepID=UPI0015529DEC|nr:NADH-quinone oxidoreductase subunit C [Campylobacter canadensis]MBZ7995108.1 NADH-quinone oxidoreductase subunit C [Campylobacter canadensis]MBZ7996610.1 NADH-quinone oxidoreductase subunit C [Campylobacter canadensis]MBZ8000477.1 NADH-quinone oxidoreductase subunit C [Campylobacter canadensis]MBZ8001936.1 NADH-quinone oxidoreductase subunit C [Campylobacter canadensis]MBZ8004406.1 NADH-quinone oxidoreductase subunit C [Campylobacter canadensis]